MAIRIGIGLGRRRTIGQTLPPAEPFDINDYPAGLVLDFSDPSKVIRTGRTVTSVLDSSGNNRTLGVIGSPQYYEEDCAIHLAPGQALFRADDGFFKSGKGAVFAIFTLKTANNQIKSVFAKYNSATNQCTVLVGASTTSRPLIITSTDGTPNSGSQLVDTVPVNEPTYLGFYLNQTAQQTQFIVDGGINRAVSGTPLTAMFNSNSGYGVNYANAGALNGDFYLHYLRVYDDETINAVSRPKIEGYLGYWYDDHMPYRNPISITPPTISGTPNVGYVLTFTPGLDLRVPYYTYQWTRNGIDIAGAIYSTYLQQVADQGAVIGCRGSIKSEDGGSAYTITGSVCGAAFGTPPNATAPVVTVAASLSGFGLNRQVLTVTPATIVVAHEVRRTYQWYVNGVQVVGAYSTTFTVPQKAEGKPIYCIESITNVYGTTTSTTNTIQHFIPPEQIFVLWYDANDYWTYRDDARTDGNDQFVTKWRNKGNTYNAATQTVALSQPTISHLKMNSFAELVFDGVDAALQLETAINLVDKTVFFVARCGRVITGYLPDINGNPDPNLPIYGAPLNGTLFSHTADNVAIRVDATGAIQFTAGTNNWVSTVSYTLPDELDSTGATVPGVSLPHIYSFSFGSELKIYVDGDLKATSATRTGTAATNFNQIGVKNVATQFFTGSISELIINPTILSDADRAKYEGELAHKYVLTANLPALHPYKTLAPVNSVGASSYLLTVL